MVSGGMGSNSVSQINGGLSNMSASKANLPADVVSQQLGSLVSDANRDAQQSILNNLKGVKLSMDE